MWETKIAHALGEPRHLGVAFSGGVDSSVLLAVAVRILGVHQVTPILALSPSLPATERAIAHEVAASLGVDIVELATHEVDDPRYRANGPDRCFFCKDALFTAISDEVAGEYGLDAIAYGENADDAQRLDRPGAQAAINHHVLRPLADAGLTKSQVRSFARELGLSVADKPASPCLSSRVPHFEEVTVEKLAQIEAAEKGVRALGFSDVRVRHHGTIARVELPLIELSRAGEPSVRTALVAAVRRAGFHYVTVDLAGLQSGEFTLEAVRHSAPLTTDNSRHSAHCDCAQHRLPRRIHNDTSSETQSPLSFPSLLADDARHPARSRRIQEDTLDSATSPPLDSIATLDLDRGQRRGFPEAVYCESKTPEQVALIATEIGRAQVPTLFTRADSTHVEAIRKSLPDTQYDDLARLAWWPPDFPPATGGNVLVACAGTSDLPVAREALLTAQALGRHTDLLVDVGVAGLHRILAHQNLLTSADAIIVVAGMDGALPSVVAGLVSAPVIAVPTSVGYGASFDGLAALLAMLNSCAPGVAVVNIDNGYGAGHLAAQITA